MVHTVKIKSEHFPAGLVINQSDFVEGEMEVFVEEAPVVFLPDARSKQTEPVTGLRGGSSVDGDSGDDDDDDPRIYTKSELSKINKAGLLEIAETLGLQIVPDDNTNAQLVELILEGQEKRQEIGA